MPDVTTLNEKKNKNKPKIKEVRVNTIFDNIRDFLLEEEQTEAREMSLPDVSCPQIAIELNDTTVHALIDTGSKITCISEEVYAKNLALWSNCPCLPVTNLQASGFTGEKSVRIKKQILLNVKFIDQTVQLVFLIIPKLIKECILGIDAQKQLNAHFDVGNEVFSIWPSFWPARIKINYGTGVLALTDRQNINNAYSYISDQNHIFIQHITSSSDDLSVDTVKKKIGNLSTLNAQQKNSLCDLVWKFRKIFDKNPGQFKNFEYKFRIKKIEPFFHKNVPIAIQDRENVDREFNRMLEIGIIERAFSEYINALVVVAKKTEQFVYV